MFEIKTRARVLTHGIKLKALAFAFLPAAAGVGCAVSLLMSALCFIYGAQTVLAGYYFAAPILQLKAAPQLLPWAFLLAGILFAVYFCALRFALRAVFYGRTAAPRQPVCGFLSPMAGLRFLWCDGLIALRRLGWLALTLLPGLITLAAGMLLLRRTGLPPGLFWLWCGITAAQLAAGAATAWVLCGRYLVTGYVLYQHPLIPVTEAVRSGVLLTRGRLGFTALCRLSALPWRVLTLIGAARPFAFSYVRMIDAVLCETLYGAEKNFEKI